MNFAETEKVINAIKDIEVWSKYLERLEGKESLDFELMEKYENYLEEAKQRVFELCTK